MGKLSVKVPWAKNDENDKRYRELAAEAVREGAHVKVAVSWDNSNWWLAIEIDPRPEGASS